MNRQGSRHGFETRFLLARSVRRGDLCFLCHAPFTRLRAGYGKSEKESVRASFFFTLKFDAAGKWKMVRTGEVPTKGVDGLNAEEHKRRKKLIGSRTRTGN